MIKEALRIYDTQKQEITIIPMSAFDDVGISAYATVSVEAFRKNLQEMLFSIKS